MKRITALAHDVRGRVEMNLRQLEAFRATMRCGSVTGAAEMLHISQPSVSRLIADLERSVGFTLFTRAGRGLAPTGEARRFHQAIEGMLLGVDRLKETAERIRCSQGGTVSLAVIPSLVQTILPEAVQSLHAAYPDLKISVAVRNTPAIIDAVIMQQIDVGVVSTSYALKDVAVLYEQKLRGVCLVPESHVLARRKRALSAADLAGESFVTHDPELMESLSLGDKLNKLVLEKACITSHSSLAIAAIARATGRLAIVDPLTAQAALALGGVVAKPLRETAKYAIAVVARSQEILSLSGRLLVDEVAAALRSHAD